MTDKHGTILRINPAGERVEGLSSKDVVGKYVQELVDLGIYSESATIKALEKRVPVTILQKVPSGKEIIATGTPIFEDGEIIRVITNSRDITELNNLKRELSQAHQLAEKYQSELEFLRLEQMKTEYMVVHSSEMKKIVTLATRVAPVDSTVLIQGESGVGKGVLSKLIHNNSKRRNGPYTYRAPVEFKDDSEATKYYLTLLREQIEFEGPDKIAAIFQETVVGSNGILIPPEGWMQGVRELCDEYGIMMVCDEVMAGWGRTGKWFAIDNWNVKPDIITFAKGVTCGYVPLGGIIVSKEIAKHFDENKLWCGLTYSGHPMGCAAACAIIDVYKEEKLIENSQEMGKVLGEILEGLKEKHPCVGDVRYIGLFSAIELVKDKATKEPLVPYGRDPEGTMKKILSILKSEGFWNYSHDNVLIVAPPLTIKEDELKEAMDIMDKVLDFVDEMIK
ncbi:aminotransferase class III-fold pyridoxal phosphate-dependent enzyme [Wukongibacter baidiensis]|uniref:aminotransferase class III-fold pyridoxal phosphate-dependent enzyme n=1 Tax=Wukongibacter baidiensis TaxID=1723361 RepID=UPI003D7F91E0